MRITQQKTSLLEHVLSWLVLRRPGLNDAQTALIVTQVGSNTEFSGDGGRFADHFRSIICGHIQ